MKDGQVVAIDQCDDLVAICDLAGRHGALVITVREGRNRQVRKMCEAIGHPVTRLKRIAIGPLRDPALKPGQWRELSEAELRRLRAAAESM